MNRTFAIDRMASHIMKLVCRTPPSGEVTSTCQGMPRARVVTGRTTTRPAGPELKRSADITITGLRPACSCPRVGSKSTNQISPRTGETGELIDRARDHHAEYCPRVLARQVPLAMPPDCAEAR